MRCKNIEVTFEVPMPTDTPDKNGIMYSTGVKASAIEDMVGIPIVQHDSDDFKTTRVLGIVTDAKWLGESAIIKGRLWYGGTCESVELDNNKVVTSMKIDELSICE